ncbi:MAG: gamma-glutamyl-gamma-aminobutyrate hydrolase family protein [Gemmatimonadota bacterium]
MTELLITCRQRDVVDRNYLPAVRLGGWEGPVRVVQTGDRAPEAASCRGLLLTGGADLHPRHWDPGEAVHPAAELDEARDALELPLIRQVWAAGRPILGICRGIQTLNVALGGSLVQDLASHYGIEVASHRCTDPALCHRVAVDPASRLAACLGSADVLVNSRHHQAVGQVAPPLRAVAHDPRPGTPVIEGIEARDAGRWVLGVQWHPENLVGLEGEAGRAARSLFRAFAAALNAT